MENPNKRNENIIPERMLRKVEPFNIGSAEVGQRVLVQSVYYSRSRRKLYCKIDNKGTMCFIKEENILYPYKANHEEVSPGISYTVGRQIVAEIEKIHSDDSVELNRAKVMKETIQELSERVGDIVNATIESIASYGLFIDIGNGVQSLLNLSEISTSRYHDLTKTKDFNVGQEIKVVIKAFDPTTKRFIVSRKDAYERKEFDCQDIIKVRICSPVNEEGFFVEADPATSGIMDLPKDYYGPKLKEGDIVVVMIKKHNENGFKSAFLRAL